MDVILAQLGSRELESHCRDAMAMQLKAMQCSLHDAMAAAMRAEEVQLASQKLLITLFEEGSELTSALLASTRLRDELTQLLERVVDRALGATTESASLEKSPGPKVAAVAAPQETVPVPASQKKRKASTQESQDSSTKKPKRSSSVASERHARDTPVKPTESAKKPRSTAALSKALTYCTKLTEELAKMKKVADRVPQLKTLVGHFNTAHKYLDPNSIIDQIEALDTLSVAAGMAVSIMHHGKPPMKRHWVQKFRDNVADIQELFPDSATAFNG
jgi:hypothetical protein